MVVDLSWQALSSGAAHWAGAHTTAAAGDSQSDRYLFAATAVVRCFCAAIHWFVLESNRSRG
jgi:hypothetical protein